MILERECDGGFRPLQVQGRCPIPRGRGELLLSARPLVGIFTEPSALLQLSRLMPTPPKKLRKQYANKDYPNVVLRFEDGHEIEILKGDGKTFDCYAGETIKILAMYDKTSKERELVESRKADAFPDA
jgi:hypothetical protein